MYADQTTSLHRGRLRRLSAYRLTKVPRGRWTAVDSSHQYNGIAMQSAPTISTLKAVICVALENGSMDGFRIITMLTVADNVGVESKHRFYRASGPRLRPPDIWKS